MELEQIEPTAENILKLFQRINAEEVADGEDALPFCIIAVNAEQIASIFEIDIKQALELAEEVNKLAIERGITE